MGTKNTAYNGDKTESPITKRDELAQNPPVNTAISDEEYLLDLVNRTRLSRSQVARENLLQQLSTPAMEYNGDVDGLGQSRFDRRITSPEQLEDLEDTRAKMQSGFGKLSSGLAKAGVFAATTFADGVAGTAAGLANMIYEGRQGNLDSGSDYLNAFIDNPVSQMLQRINKASEDIFHNYYTQEERERPWWQNMGTANFWGDTILKNAGFTLGAAYSGKLTAGALGKLVKINKAKDAFAKSMKGLTQEMAKVAEGHSPSQILKMLSEGTLTITDDAAKEALAQSARQLKAASMAMKGVGALSSAMGEARIESINAINEYVEGLGDIEGMRTQAYIDAMDELIRDYGDEHPEWFQYVTSPTGGTHLECVDPEGQKILAEKYAHIDEEYNKYMSDVAENSKMIGNVVFGLNTALLSAGNLAQFGRFMAGNYDTGRLTAKGIEKAAEKVTGKNAIEQLAKTTYKAPSRGDRITKGVAAGIRNTATEFQEEMNQSFISSMAKYAGTHNVGEFMERLYDPEGEIEAISWLNRSAVGAGLRDSWGNADTYVEGFAGGLMGFLGMPSITVKTRKNGTQRKGITMNGGVWEPLRDQIQRNKLENQAVEELNKRLQEPEFLDYYYGLVARKSTETAAEDAVASGDKQKYDKFKHMQLISDMVMFKEAGRLDDFTDMIDGLTDNDVSDSTIEEIKSMLGEENFEGVSKETLKAQIKSNAEDIKKQVKDYIKVTNNLEVLYGTDADKQFLQEMTWQTVRLNDINDKIKKLTDSLSAVEGEYRNKVASENNVPLSNNPLTVQTSEGFTKYLAEQDSEKHTSETSEAVKQQQELAELDKIRKKYVDNISKLSADPTIVLRHMQTLQTERAKEMQKRKDAMVMEDIDEEISTFGQFSEKYRNKETGELDSAIVETLKKNKAKGNEQATFLLNAEGVNREIIKKIKAATAKIPIDEKQALQAWEEHIANATNMNEVFSEIKQDETKYPNSVVDFVNNIISVEQARNAQGDELDDVEPIEEEEDNENEDIVGHEFIKINVPSTAKVYDKNGNKLDAGEYFFDKKSKAVYNTNGKRLGKIYKYDNGSNKSSISDMSIAGGVEGITYKYLGVVGEDGIIPSGPTGFPTEVMPSGEETKEEHQPFDDFTTGETVYDAETGKQGRIDNNAGTRIRVSFTDGTHKFFTDPTKVSKTPIAPPKEETKPLKPAEQATGNTQGPQPEPTGTVTNPNKYIRPFNVVRSALGKLEPNNKIRFAVLGNAPESRIELWHNDEKVGELPTDPEIIKQYAGLQELIDKLHGQYDSLAIDDKTNMRFAVDSKGNHLTSTVRNVYKGAFTTTDKDVPLSQIPNMPAKPIFAMILPGDELKSSEPIDDSTVISGRESMREGYSYMLIPDGFGRMLPVELRQRKVTTSDFNLLTKISKPQQSPFVKEMYDTIKSLVDAYATNNGDVFNKLVPKIKSLFYFQYTDAEGYKRPVEISINRTTRGIEIKYKEKGKDNGKPLHTSKYINDVNEFIKELQDEKWAPIVSVKFRNSRTNFNDINDINNDTFAEDAIASDIYTANIADYNLSDPGFNMDYFVLDDAGGHFEEVELNNDASTNNISSGDERVATETQEPEPIEDNEDEDDDDDVNEEAQRMLQSKRKSRTENEQTQLDSSETSPQSVYLSENLSDTIHDIFATVRTKYKTEARELSETFNRSLSDANQLRNIKQDNAVMYNKLTFALSKLYEEATKNKDNAAAAYVIEVMDRELNEIVNDSESISKTFDKRREENRNECHKP